MRMFARWTGIAKVVIALLVLIIGAAAVHAQKGGSDNPFAPASGNPFATIATRLDGISSQLEGLIKNVNTLIRRPDADGRTRLYTGYVRLLNESGHGQCLLANVGPNILRNVVTRVVDYAGTVRFSSTSDMEGPLLPGRGTGYGFSGERFTSVRCEFIFDDLPEHVRATIAADDGFILEAR